MLALWHTLASASNAIRLLDQVVDAVNQYSECAVAMMRLADVGDRDRYLLVQQQADAPYIVVLTAADAYYRHVDEHECSRRLRQRAGGSGWCCSRSGLTMR